MADLRWTLSRSSRTTRDEVADGTTLLVPGQSVEVVPITKLANAEWRCKELEAQAEELEGTLEEIAGEAYLWQIDDGPQRRSEDLIEHLRKLAYTALQSHEQEEREK